VCATVRRLERERGLRRVPIIACTASVLPEERRECSAVGMDDHLSKPMTARELTRMLQTYVECPASPDVRNPDHGQPLH
jgi:CheY-like chemotaxis protein